MKVALAGEGAIARKHLAAIKRMDHVEVASLSGGDEKATRALAKEFDIPHYSLNLDESIERHGVLAVILATPTQLHAQQAIQVLEAGLHVLIEIPMADTLDDSMRIARASEVNNRIAMCCHTRRFSPAHRWIRNRIINENLVLEHLVAETLFFRRRNENLLGQIRGWTDDLLWHHACHTVDLFHYQTGIAPIAISALKGPFHSELEIPMDMSISLKNPTEVLCSIVLSFNNDGPQGSTYRYICDQGTFIVKDDILTYGSHEPIDLSSENYAPGIEIQDNEFFDAISTGRQPDASVQDCLATMNTLACLDTLLRDSNS